MLRESARRGFARGDFRDDCALLHHRHAIGDRHDFAELVRDENHRFALRSQGPQHGEELIRLVRREHRRRFIQDQNLGSTVKRFKNFHALLEPDRQF